MHSTGRDGDHEADRLDHPERSPGENKSEPKGETMTLKIDLTGQRFGRLTAIIPTEKRRGRCVIWLCRCDCGNLTEVSLDDLRREHTKSCGCLHREISQKRSGNLSHLYKHGRTRTRLYRIWNHMKDRCLNPNHIKYHRYGGRGINVWPEWKGNFVAFKFWAILSGYQNNLTIDRIDNDGNYEPDNCQWITRAENARKGIN